MGADSKANNISRQKIGSFYIVSYPPRALPSGREFLNSDEVCRGSGSVIMAPPTRFQRGFRNYAVRPKFLVSKRLGRRPHDIEYYLDYWLVSDLARQFLDAISQTDFIYLPVDTEVDAGSEPATYWLCDAAVVLDAVDEARSEVGSMIADDGSKVHRLIGSYSLVFDENIVGGHDVFRMKTFSSKIICSARFKAAFKQAGLTGLSFIEASQLAFDKLGTVTALSPVGKIKPQGRGKDIVFFPDALNNPNKLPKIGQTVRVQGRHVKHGAYYLASRIEEIDVP
jgi:hypothetical protein